MARREERRVNREKPPYFFNTQSDKMKKGNIQATGNNKLGISIQISDNNEL